MNNERSEYLKEKMEDKIQNFIDDDLFSIGWWDGDLEYDEITDAEFEALREMFEINIDVVYKGP